MLGCFSPTWLSSVALAEGRSSPPTECQITLDHDTDKSAGSANSHLAFPWLGTGEWERALPPTQVCTKYHVTPSGYGSDNSKTAQGVWCSFFLFFPCGRHHGLGIVCKHVALFSKMPCDYFFPVRALQIQFQAQMGPSRYFHLNSVSLLGLWLRQEQSRSSAKFSCRL